ncbi:hypothetical protein [Caproicibacter fermentans]|uniref:Peptidase M1 membrane alanine aminopeptidase domain-containing protein n=1 Tax=Caproicibacter fermentans TaxID=2576756 RepID=A0A7G8TDS7_9FIRM|nr:hypothetical protein [Caproicibacter fermentans]QNK41768.1 hypothetical protein HCR03_05845 [Caproicibacter fermentans]
MNAFEKLSREIERMLRDRLILLFIALTSVGAVWFCLNTSGRTASDAYILEPAKNSAILGALLFSVLTLAQFHRDYKNHTDAIILTCTDSIFYQLRRTLALICTAVGTAWIVTLFAFPFALAKTGVYFQPGSFAASWYLIFLGALIFSILLSAGFYLLFRRVEAAFVAVVCLIVLSKLLESQSALNPSFLLFWVQTNADCFSDLVSNQFQIDLILWNRLFCFLVSLSIWLMGLWGSRRYGRGVFSSFVSNARRAWIPVLLIAATVLSYGSFAAEPYFDHSVPRDYSAAYSSGTGIVVSSGGDEVGNPSLLLTNKSVKVDIDTAVRCLSGEASYTLRNTSGGAQTLPVLLNSGYTVGSIQVNGASAQAVRDPAEKEGNATWRINLPNASEYAVVIRYAGKVGNDGSLSQKPVYGICNEYVDLPATGFSPKTDVSVADDCGFSGTLSLDERLEPVFTRANGVKGKTANGKTQWQFASEPGNDRTGLDAAVYDTTTFKAGGLNVEFKYFTKQKAAIADMGTIAIMKDAIDYFTNAFGPLLYQDHLTVLELPAYFSGGGAFGNISAMDETSFAVAGYLPDGAGDPDSGGGIDVLVHELAHQWWGLATYPMADGKSYWSAEGITCYSTYCFMKDYFGADYANSHFVSEWQKNLKSYRNAFYIQNPTYLKKLSPGDQSNVKAALNNIGLYDIMPLQFVKAEKALGGSGALQKKLSELYLKHLGQPITYDDFLAAVGLAKEALDLA